MFKWRCGICVSERDCKALALRDGYLSFVCSEGHHQVVYGVKRKCGKCSKETLQVELLVWRKERNPCHRSEGYICCECGSKELLDKPTEWRDD
ncbi:MAG: hypothetical protein N2234_01855 [Planctomycetota bacterium]|nr:hypothetical protein [Planctomycetota bacterium]